MTTNCHAEENINVELINKRPGIFIFASTYICLDINKIHFNPFQTANENLVHKPCISPYSGVC